MKKRNYIIELLRLFFAIEIVALHSSPLAEVNGFISYFCSQTISRLGVPFFSAVAGYFFFGGAKKKNYDKYLKRYIFIYSFWSCLMLIYDAILWNDSSTLLVVHIFKTFFLLGWHQLWYLLGIIYLLLILLLLNNLTDRANEIVFKMSFIFLAWGICIDNYGNIFRKISFFNIVYQYDANMISGFITIIIPFFMMGYLLNKPISESLIRHSLGATLSCLVGLLIEIFITTVFDLHQSVALCLFTYPTVFFLLVWSLKSTKEKNANGIIAKYAGKMASAIYFIHYLPIVMLYNSGVTETPTFLISCGISIVIGFILIIQKNNYIKKIL